MVKRKTYLFQFVQNIIIFIVRDACFIFYRWQSVGDTTVISCVPMK